MDHFIRAEYFVKISQTESRGIAIELRALTERVTERVQGNVRERYRG